MSKFFLISNMYPTLQNPGYGIFVKNIVNALGKYGISVKCKAVIRGKCDRKVKKIISYLSFYLQILIKYWEKYNFIYIHFPNQSLPVLYPLLKVRPKKLVINFHGEDLLYEPKGYTGKLGKLMEKTCRNFATVVVVPSPYFKNIVLSKNMISSDRIIISPSGGINENIFFSKGDYNNHNSLIRLGYVGRLESDKGIIEYLEVCRRLKKNDMDFLGVIIGYGSMYEYTKNFLMENRLSKCVELIQGIAQSELGEFYRTMDLLIFSSSRFSESLGLTGIEAMACGTPVIGSNIGGIASYIESGYNGWLTPVHDIDAIINSIREYQSMSTSEKILMRKHCIKTGQKYFSTKVAKKLAEELKSIISNQ